MSAYITMLTPMTDQECLLAALLESGIEQSKIMVSATPVELRGWQRGQKAHIVLPREVTGDAHNEVGFFHSATGFVAILSDDNARFDRDWLRKINSTYQSRWAAKQERLAAEERRRLDEERQRVVEAQRQAVHDRAKKLGYSVNEKREGDKIRLVLVKRTY